MKSTNSRSTSGASRASASKKAAPKAAPAKKATASASGSKVTAAPAAKNRGTAAPATRSTAKTTTPARSTTTARGNKSAGSRNAKSASPTTDLTKIMVDTLKDIYYAEKQLVKGLNKMAKAAAHEELRTAFESHRTETEQQIKQLEQVFELLGQRAQGKKCAAMDGLLDEGSEHIEEYEKGAARDAVLIVGAQKIEHYEIAAYGSLCSFAKLLGKSDVQQIFQNILDQESDTDEKLTGLSQMVNQEALDSEEEMETEKATLRKA